MIKAYLDAFCLHNRSRIVGWMLMLVLVLPVGVRAAAAPQVTFPSPEQAGAALAAAWREGDKAELLRIFGPEGMPLVSSGDVVAERDGRLRLAAAYQTQHRIERQGEQKALLIIGKDEFPYPIPLVKQADAWYFDTNAGVEEILDRRIGRNELNAIEVSRAYVEAQRDYASRHYLGDGQYEYAMKIVSSEGRRDGLYWPAGDEDESPLGPLIADAAAEGYDVAGQGMREPYHGYYFKILTRQGANASGGVENYVVDGHLTGGFAWLAYPAQYGDSGIMSFVVNQNGIVFEKNLGPDTASIAGKMTAFNPDKTWKTPARSFE